MLTTQRGKMHFVFQAYDSGPVVVLPRAQVTAWPWTMTRARTTLQFQKKSSHLIAIPILKVSRTLLTALHSNTFGAKLADKGVEIFKGREWEHPTGRCALQRYVCVCERETESWRRWNFPKMRHRISTTTSAHDILEQFNNSGRSLRLFPQWIFGGQGENA